MRRWEQANGGDGCVVLDLGRARYRQVADRSDYRGTGRRRATHAVTLFLLAASPGQRALPSIAQLERAAGYRREDTAEQQLAKLEAVLAQGTNDLNEAVPLLTDLLSIPTGDRYPPLNLTPQKRKEKTLHAPIGSARRTGGPSTGVDGVVCSGLDVFFGWFDMTK